MSAKIIARIIAAVTVASTLAACGASTDPAEQAPANVQEAKSSLQRDMNPNVADQKVSELVEGNNAFDYDLYHQLASDPTNEGKNLFYSSYSISSALGMVYAGARGDTEKQMAKVLHYTLSQKDLHPAFNKLDLTMAASAKANDFQLNVANATWGDQTQHFEQPYLDTLAVNYGAGLNLVDFLGNPEGSRSTINSWVSDQTQGKIPELMPSGSITQDTRFVLTNAIYFKAKWAREFEGDDTYEGSFTKLDQSQASAMMMHDAYKYRYFQSDNVSAIELPYRGNAMSMLIMIPPVDRYANFEADLSAKSVATIESQMHEGMVHLTLPRFQFSSQFEQMGDTLQKMGMKDAFGGADFSGITGDKSLGLSAVVHKAFVAVNEKGTEAAAATGAAMAGAAPNQVYISATSPFVFVIRDTKTGAVLFTGRVMDPSAK